MNSKGYFYTQNQFKTFLLKISGIQKKVQSKIYIKKTLNYMKLLKISESISDIYQIL
jgi:hypothetical protein